MQTDIMLSHAGRTLIIDAKYYEHSLQQLYDSYSVHSGNLYQIFTYVKNKEVELSNRSMKVFQECFYMQRQMKQYIQLTNIRCAVIP